VVKSHQLAARNMACTSTLISWISDFHSGGGGGGEVYSFIHTLFNTADSKQQIGEVVEGSSHGLACDNLPMFA